jgi:hypothetical protein
MERPVEAMRAAVEALKQSLDPESFALIQSSRGLEAIIDKRFRRHVIQHKWYSVISKGGYTHAVADIDGKRISLQRYILVLANPALNIEEVKDVSFVNKVAFDCRAANLVDRVGRTAVMRNRRPKKNTTSKFKGVSKTALKSGEVRWKVQIKATTDQLYLGAYVDEVWAATVYDAAAYLLFENAALYNLPDICPHPDALKIAAERIARTQRRSDQASDEQDQSGN